MMTRPIRSEGLGRAAPSKILTRVALLGLALVAFSFEGCATLGLGNGGCGLGKCLGLGGGATGCNTCGFGSRGLGLFRGGLFRNRRTEINTYEPAAGGVVPMEGIPIQGPSSIPAVPSESEANPIIEPAPSNATKSSSNGQGSRTGTNKAVYQTEITSRSGGPKEARRSTASGRAAMPTFGSATLPVSEDDPLANLPEPTPPNEIPSEASPPRSPSAGDRPPMIAPKLEPAPASASAELPLKPAEVAAVSSLAPGIRRFKALDSTLAAGSLPSDAGWAWLVEKGFKTVLDLRQPNEIKPEEIAAIDHYGLRHVALPTSTTAFDATRLKRFGAEIAQESARPIYIFDQDGSRPAALYFLHEVTVAKKERRSAEHDVDDLGVADTTAWKAANDFLAAQSSVSMVPSLGLPTTDLALAPVSASLPADLGPPLNLPEFAGVETRPLPVHTPRDHRAWKPYATIALAVLGVPLAYVGRSALSLGGRALASLPAPRIARKSLPSSSDV